MQMLVAIMLIRFLAELLGRNEIVNPVIKKINKKRKGGFMFRKIFGGRINDVQLVFKDHFVEVKALYAMHFAEVPCVTFIGELDATKALAHVRKNFDQERIAFAQHAYYDHEEKDMRFNAAIIVLKDKRIIEVNSNYCQVLHGADQYKWAINLVKELAEFKIKSTSDAPATVVGFARQTVMN